MWNCCCTCLRFTPTPTTACFGRHVPELFVRAVLLWQTPLSLWLPSRLLHNMQVLLNSTYVGNKLMFRSEWRQFPSAPCLTGKKSLMTARVSMLLKSRASLTCFRACFLPGRAKDLSAPRYITLHRDMRNFDWVCLNTGLITVVYIMAPRGAGEPHGSKVARNVEKTKNFLWVPSGCISCFLCKPVFRAPHMRSGSDFADNYRGYRLSCCEGWGRRTTYPWPR